MTIDYSSMPIYQDQVIVFPDFAFPGFPRQAADVKETVYLIGADAATNVVSVIGSVDD